MMRKCDVTCAWFLSNIEKEKLDLIQQRFKYLLESEQKLTELQLMRQAYQQL